MSCQSVCKNFVQVQSKAQLAGAHEFVFGPEPYRSRERPGLPIWCFGFYGEFEPFFGNQEPGIGILRIPSAKGPIQAFRGILAVSARGHADLKINAKLGYPPSPPLGNGISGQARPLSFAAACGRSKTSCTGSGWAGVFTTSSSERLRRLRLREMIFLATCPALKKCFCGFPCSSQSKKLGKFRLQLFA